MGLNRRPPKPTDDTKSIAIYFLAVYKAEMGENPRLLADTCAGADNLKLADPIYKDLAVEYQQPGYRTVIAYGDKKYWVVKRQYTKVGGATHNNRRFLYLQEITDFSPETHQWIDSVIADRV